jgi:hypothetical protein
MGLFLFLSLLQLLPGRGLCVALSVEEDLLPASPDWPRTRATCLASASLSRFAFVGDAETSSTCSQYGE